MKTNILSPGKKINHRYTIISVISEGASAVTYKAKDHICNDICCIKELLPKKISNNITRVRDSLCFIDSLTIPAQVASDIYQNYLTIFKREKNLLERIQTKGTDNEYSILKLRDYFVENGFCYNVYETAKCKSLAEIIRNTPLTTDNFKFYLDIISKLLCALNDIHANDVLHLDIAPDNVLLMSESQNTVRIIDFGSALENYDRKKQPDNFIYSSKEGFSPLELIEYSKANTKFVPKLSPATDIFSVAAILFKIIVGRTIDCSDYLVDDWKQILRSKLPFRSSKEYDIQENIIRILECGLSNSMEKRYQSANKMLDEIEELKKQIDLAPEKIKKEKHKQKAKKSLAIAGVAVVTLAIIACNIVRLPYTMINKAETELSNGNAKKAYEILLDIHNSVNWGLSEEDIESLAWKVYHHNTISTINYDEPVVQSVLNSDNEIVTLLNDKIVINNPLVKESSRIYSITNSDGYLSWNGSFYATISDENLVVYYMDSFESEPQIISKNVRNFSFDEIGSSLAIVDTNNKLKTINLLTQESTEKNLGERQVLNYVKGQKTLDFNSNSTKVAFIDTNGCANVLDLDNGEMYKHTPDNTMLKFIQISTEANTYPTVQLSDLSSRTFEYNFKDDYFGLAISPLRYNYFISPDSGWRILWHSSSSLKDKTLYISDKSVTLKLCVTDAMNHVRIMPPSGESFIKEYNKLFDICDIEGDYYYDYDNQEKTLYRTHINQPIEQALPIKCDFVLDDVVELIVHNDSILIATNDKIAFFRINNNTALLDGSPIVLPDNNKYFESLNKEAFAYTDDSSIIIYRFDGNKWLKCGQLPIIENNSSMYGVIFNEDGTKMCVEYSNASDEITTMNIYNLSEQTIEQEKSEKIDRLFNVLSTDMQHGFVFRDNRPLLRNVEKTNYLTGSKDNITIEQTDEFDNEAFAIKDHIITKHVLEGKKIIYDNDKRIKTQNAISNIVQNGKYEITFIERTDNKDYLITYNILSQKIVKIPLSIHMFEQPPSDYKLVYIDENHIGISAKYKQQGVVLNSLHKQLTLEQLLKKCEELYK